jgi:hypothetical protein
MIAIRKDTCNGSPRLQAFRKFERTWSLGQAYQTPSGKWIVSTNNMPQDAFDTEKEARAELLKRLEPHTAT